MQPETNQLVAVGGPMEGIKYAERERREEK